MRIHGELMGAFDRYKSLTIDASGITQVDITFVQLVVSAEKKSALDNLPFSLDAASDCVLTAFERAGAALPVSRSASSISG